MAELIALDSWPVSSRGSAVSVPQIPAFQTGATTLGFTVVQGILPGDRIHAQPSPQPPDV